MKVLVVDDSSIMRRLLVKCLNRDGYSDTIQAADGNEALEVLSKNKDVGLILADWCMPNMDGFKLLKEIRNNRKTKKIPVIMVTTMREKNSVVKALQSGVSGYVVKPFTIKLISEKIKEVMGQK